MSKTGWATWDEHGEVIESGAIKNADEFLDWLEQLTPFPKAVILEGYFVNPQFGGNHSGSDVPTLQLIGAIKRVCTKKKVPLHVQKSDILPVACRYIGFVYSKSLPDQVSAIAHGAYWLQKNKIRINRRAKQ